MITIRLKNNTQTADYWIGVQIQPGEYYTLQNQTELDLAIASEKVNQDIWANPKRLIINNGTLDISSSLEASNYLKGYIPQTVTTTGTRCPNGMRARLTGIGSISALANQTTDLDWQIPQLTYNNVNKNSYFDGIQIFAENGKIGDTALFQVIDVNNILGYGAGTVIEEFGKDWFIIPNEYIEIKLYNAKLINGLYLRIKYTNTHASNNVMLVCNIFRHLDQNS